MHVPLKSTKVHQDAYPQSTDEAKKLQIQASQRGTSIWRGKDLGTPNQKIELLYGESSLTVFDPPSNTWSSAPTGKPAVRHLRLQQQVQQLHLADGCRGGPALRRHYGLELPRSRPHHATAADRPGRLGWGPVDVRLHDAAGGADQHRGCRQLSELRDSQHGRDNSASWTPLSTLPTQGGPSARSAGTSASAARRRPAGSCPSRTTKIVDWLEVRAETRWSSTTLGRDWGSRLSKPVSTRSRVARPMERMVRTAITPSTRPGWRSCQPTIRSSARRNTVWGRGGAHGHPLPAGEQAQRW